MTEIIKPNLAEGERYIGAIVDAEGVATHIILLPGDNDGANWEAQKAWAESIGGDLPSRVEQALLFATANDEFADEAYWSNQAHASADSGWCQYFTYGLQDYYGLGLKLRARAVRRLII